MHPLKRMRFEYASSLHGISDCRYDATSMAVKAQRARDESSAFFGNADAMKHATQVGEEFFCRSTSDSLLGKHPTSSNINSSDSQLAIESRLVTPTETPRMKLSKVLLCKEVSPSIGFPNPPMTSPTPQNPLEMLSSVSSHVSEKQKNESYIGTRNKAGQRHGTGIMMYTNGCR